MKKLYRSTSNRVIAGVCAGIGEYFEVDPVLIRILFILLLIGTGFFPFGLAYMIAALVVPEKPHDNIVSEQ